MTGVGVDERAARRKAGVSDGTCGTEYDTEVGRRNHLPAFFTPTGHLLSPRTGCTTPRTSQAPEAQM